MEVKRMRNLGILTEALAFIEENLLTDLTQGDIARACCCSLSTLQKLFRYAFQLSIKECVTKRRLTLAARDLLNGEETVLTVALRYRYNSPEVFGRAFARVWGATPSAFRRQWRFAGLFPRFTYSEGGGDTVAVKRLDISELYEYLTGLKETYVLCFDVMGLMGINQELGRAAGDLVIRACLKRIDEAAAADMLLVRIGGDEFALATGRANAAEAREIGQRLAARNGEPIAFKGTQIPVRMRVGLARIAGERLQYEELFAELQATIQRTREA